MTGRDASSGGAEHGSAHQQMIGVVADNLFQIENVGGDVRILLGRPLYRLEQLTAGGIDLSVEEARTQPSRLLLARYEVVSFTGRGNFLHRLSDWLEEAVPVSVRMIHGTGGQGKTRLAVHFAREHASGWTTWHVRQRLVSARGPDRLTVQEGSAGVLVIVDYADRWAPSHLQALIADLRIQIGRLPASRLRFLLLARSAGFWWSGLEDILDAEYGIPAAAMSLPPLGEDIDRRELFTAARDQFAIRMGVTQIAQVPVTADLSKPEFNHVLTVHMAALTAVDAWYHGAAPPRDPERLSAYLLKRERAHWHEMHIRAEEPMLTSPKAMGRAVYVATLAGPLPRAQGVDVLSRAQIATQTEVATQILDDHRDCYPPTDPGTVLEPLYPDRLGEDFIALTTSSNNLSEADDWATTAIGSLLTPRSDEALGHQAPPYIPQAMTVLVETARHWSHIARNQLSPLLRQDPSLAIAAGATTLSRLIDMPEIDLGALVEIDSYLTDPDGQLDVELYEVTADLAERVFNSRLEDESDQAKRAVAYVDFGRKLGYAGQYDKARLNTGVGVHLYRELYANSGKFGAELAMALTQLAWQLYAIGQPEQTRLSAEQAISIWQKLPDSEGARPKDVGESFNSLGIALDELGEEDAARKAFQRSLRLREQYLDQLPEKQRERSPLAAASLLNIGVTFYHSEQWGELKRFTEKSVQTYRVAIEAGHRGGGRACDARTGRPR